MTKQDKAKLERLIARHCKLLQEILTHQVANMGTEHEFYSCYTYEDGRMPPWVAKAKKLIKPT